jgi:hypothetical protein
MPFTPKLSMREEVFMYLRRLGFPVEICDMIISKGALGGHLPIFSAVGKYVGTERGGLMKIGDVNFPSRWMDNFNANYLENAGRVLSIQNAKLELAYGGYYDEILEEEGIDWMLDDMEDRYTDSVSGEENKVIMIEYFMRTEAIEEHLEPLSHSTNEDMFRFLCATSILRRFTGLRRDTWTGDMLTAYHNPYVIRDVERMVGISAEGIALIEDITR